MKSVINISFTCNVNVPIVPRYTCIISSLRKIDKRKQVQKQNRCKRDRKKYTTDSNAGLYYKSKHGTVKSNLKKKNNAVTSTPITKVAIHQKLPWLNKIS